MAETSGNETKTETSPPSSVIVPPVPGPYSEGSTKKYAWTDIVIETDSESLTPERVSVTSYEGEKSPPITITSPPITTSSKTRYKISAGSIEITEKQDSSHIPVQVNLPAAKPCGGCGGAKAGGGIDILGMLAEMMPAFASMFRREEMPPSAAPEPIPTSEMRETQTI